MTGKKTKLPLYFLSLHRTEQTSHARTLKRRRVRSSLRRPKARPQQRWARSAASGSTRSGQGWTRECSTQSGQGEARHGLSGQGGRAERPKRELAGRAARRKPGGSTTWHTSKARGGASWAQLRARRAAAGGTAGAGRVAAGGAAGLGAAIRRCPHA
jgi:hypothetical protein